MTIPSFDAVGYCAHYSPTGDLAFDFALDLARAGNRQLNVFHFLDDPYLKTRPAPRPRSVTELARLATERERELRLYYDERAGDYMEVGFRLCEDESWRELHRCLAGHEFQVLVLARPDATATFCGRPIEDFAQAFVCPVVLVGPGDDISLNNSAAVIVDRLGLKGRDWTPTAHDDARSA